MNTLDHVELYELLWDETKMTKQRLPACTGMSAIPSSGTVANL